MEFGMYCISSNKKYPLFFLVDLFVLQCAYAAVHTAKCELITIPHEMHPESVFNIDTVSNTCFLTFLSKTFMYVVTSKCNSVRFLWKEINYI
jgi:hypothetical protein